MERRSLSAKKKYTAKKKPENKEYQTPYGAVQVKRYVYQSSSGGRIYVPLEKGARIIHGSTPKFAKMLSHKYSAMSAKEVLDDLLMNHGRALSKKYLQRVSETVSEIVQNKEDNWEYVLPELKGIATVVVSMDGAMLPTCQEGWRESMIGTITLYDNQNTRVHTVYIGEAPEYGKQHFMVRMKKEIKKIKTCYPQALYLSIADGAKNNWAFLESHTDKQLLDFYHVTEYLAKCAYAAYPEKTGKPKRTKWLNERCHQLKHNKGSPSDILHELKRFSRKIKLCKEVQENLKSAITYFTNNIHRMNYAEHTENNLPIGSGVTEAACKTLIKQRFCKSGMRWKQLGIKSVLRLRDLVQTTGRWQQFWNKLTQYGVPAIT